MKNKFILKIFISLCALSAMASCNSSKVKQETMADDCSMVLENPSDQNSSMNNASTPRGACKVMHVNIDKNTKCDISGSNKIDNILDFYGRNFSSDRIILYAPIDQIVDSDTMSFKNLMTLYKIKLDIKKHVDSDLFEPLKNYKYKGMTCNVENGKVTAWLGDKKALVAIEGQVIEQLANDTEQKVDKAKTKVKKVHHKAKKAIKHKM